MSSVEFDKLDKMRKAEIMALYLLELRMGEVVAYDQRPKGKPGADSLDSILGGLSGLS